MRGWWQSSVGDSPAKVTVQRRWQSSENDLRGKKRKKSAWAVVINLQRRGERYQQWHIRLKQHMAPRMQIQHPTLDTQLTLPLPRTKHVLPIKERNRKTKRRDDRCTETTYPLASWLGCIWAVVALFYRLLFSLLPTIQYHSIRNSGRKLAWQRDRMCVVVHIDAQSAAARANQSCQSASRFKPLIIAYFDRNPDGF